MKLIYWSITLNLIFGSVLLASSIEWSDHDQSYVLCEGCPTSPGLVPKISFPLSIKFSEPPFALPAVVNPEPRVEVIYFERGSAEISKKDQEKVMRLVQNGRMIYSIRGYASEDGSLGFNNDLSIKRANTIANILGRNGREVKDLTGAIEWGSEPYCFSRKVEIRYSP